MRRVLILASASGSGKTTLARELAARLDVPHIELDALHHGPGWAAATAAALRTRVEPLVAGEGCVVDGHYLTKLGPLVLDRADTVVWLDLPPRVWLPRLLRRTIGLAGYPTIRLRSAAEIRAFLASLQERP